MAGPTDPYLTADLRTQRGDYVLDAQLEARAGEVVAVIGPNGAGKSTLLGALAGTLASAGTIEVDGRSWQGLPSHQRRVGLVHQDHSLFPHLSALANVAYGPRARGTSRAASRRTAQALLDRFGVGDLASRRPGQLSGGQSQRVAVARALATDPQVLLLDEPFAALDVAVAVRLREELRAHLVGFGGVSVLVTHDAVDLFTLADRLLVVEGGRVVQTGTPDEVAAHPATAHAARLIGRNVLTGTAQGTRVGLDSGLEMVIARPATGLVLVTFSPSAVTVSNQEPHGSARNRWRSLVRHLDRDGDVVRVHLDPPGLLADLAAEAATELDLRVGSAVWASVKATDTTVVPPTGEALVSAHE